MFGFDFQVNAAIVLMLENIKHVKSLRLEGDHEDIEIELDDSKFILAQAKAVVNSSVDFKNVRKNLKKAICSLSEGAEKSNVSQLIFITNSPNPLNQRADMGPFYGHAHREYKTLPISSKNLINGYLEQIEKPLDTNKFMIHVLPFETSNDKERYKIVRQTIDDFVGDLKIHTPGVSLELMRIWQSEVFKNGTKDDVALKLQKSDIIWPLMVLVTDVERVSEKIFDFFDENLYEEIINKYKELIEYCCERCEFFIKVLSDYQTFETRGKAVDKWKDFVQCKWIDYQSEFTLINEDEEIEKGLIQVILYCIIRNNRIIDRIKSEVNL